MIIADARPNHRTNRRLAFLWFGHPASTKPFAGLRIGVALIALFQAYLAFPYLKDFVGSSAIIQPEVARFFVHPALPNLNGLLSWCTERGMTLEIALSVIWGGWIFLLLLLLAGCGTRAVGWLVWLAHLAIKTSGAAASYGVSEFLNILFFYTALGPAGELWSIDALRRRRHRIWAWEAGLILRVMRLHLCAVYLSSGIEKALAQEWWNGEAFWRALAHEDRFWVVPYVLAMPWLLKLMGWWTLAVEIGYTPMTAWRRTRWLWLAQAAMLHLGIAIFLNLWLFSAAMILFNAVVFPALWERQMWTRARSGAVAFLDRVRNPWRFARNFLAQPTPPK